MEHLISLVPVLIAAAVSVFVRGDLLRKVLRSIFRNPRHTDVLLRVKSADGHTMVVEAKEGSEEFEKIIGKFREGPTDAERGVNS